MGGRATLPWQSQQLASESPQWVPSKHTALALPLLALRHGHEPGAKAAGGGEMGGADGGELAQQPSHTKTSRHRFLWAHMACVHSR